MRTFIACDENIMSSLNSFSKLAMVKNHDNLWLISWGLMVWIMSRKKYLIGRPYVLVIFLSLPVIFHVIIYTLKTSHMR